MTVPLMVVADATLSSLLPRKRHFSNPFSIFLVRFVVVRNQLVELGRRRRRFINSSWE
jgi:hypothetical protein